MNKNLAAAYFLLAALLQAFGAGPAGAQIQQGDSLLALGLGIGWPVSGINPPGVGGGSQSPGRLGLGVDGQYLHQVNDSVGLGGEVQYASFGDRTFSPPKFGTTIRGSLLTLEGIARCLFTPGRSVSPYILGGVGVNRFAAHAHETRDPANVLLDADSTGVAFSMGGGVEGSLNESLLAGAELRLRLASIDSGKFGASWFNSLNWVARLGWKF